jgi:hypothetical protein
VAEAGRRRFRRAARAPHIDEGELGLLPPAATPYTYAAHGSTPYLNARRSSARMAADDAGAYWLMFVAERGGRTRGRLAGGHRPRARRGPGAATGGCVEQPRPACTSRPATTSRCSGAIEQGFVRFEGGAQGEHKMARGLLPVATPLRALAARRSALPARWRDFLAARGSRAWRSIVDELRERNALQRPGLTAPPRPLHPLARPPRARSRVPLRQPHAP